MSRRRGVGVALRKLISITVLLNWGDTYEGQSCHAGSSPGHRSGCLSNQFRHALGPHTDIHSRNSGSRSPSDAEAKAEKSNKKEKKHATRIPNANGRLIILSENVYVTIKREELKSEGERVGRVKIR